MVGPMPAEVLTLRPDFGSPTSDKPVKIVRVLLGRKGGGVGKGGRARHVVAHGVISQSHIRVFETHSFMELSNEAPLALGGDCDIFELDCVSNGGEE